MMAINLHIGCGDDIKPGYVNIDEFNPRADLRIPIQDISYPDDSVDLIEGMMVLEHLSFFDAQAFVAKAYRMLRAGGRLILEMPDLEKVCRLTLVFVDDPEQLEKGAFGLRGFFGEPKSGMTVGDLHKWGYTQSTAAKLLRDAGFTRFSLGDGTSHCFPLRDMRVEAIK
jgi:hypothetical protein